jgi:hypothetical protein
VKFIVRAAEQNQPCLVSFGANDVGKTRDAVSRLSSATGDIQCGPRGAWLFPGVIKALEEIIATGDREIHEITDCGLPALDS